MRIQGRQGRRHRPLIVDISDNGTINQRQTIRAELHEQAARVAFVGQAFSSPLHPLAMDRRYR